jgi:membrane-associated phospholipid phosphatase
VRSISRTADIASSLALAGVGAATAFAALSTPGLRRGNFAVLADATTWTAASAQWLKVAIHRMRPVLYTSSAPSAVGDRNNQESMPSGHAALAFAAATSYFVIARREHLAHRVRNSILLYAGAVGVSALRVAAGKHFPTDVLASAGLGIGMGWLVPTIHR